MKEIKFRLILDKEIVGYEYHLIDEDLDEGICIYHQSIQDYKENKPESKYPITGGDRWFIFHDAKDLYTGLKDKNKKEYYYHDLVNAGLGSLYEVVWYENGWQLQSLENKHLFMKIDEEYDYIVGNRWDKRGKIKIRKKMK